MRLAATERKRVEEAIRRAEAGAGADFVCVLVGSASDYAFYPLAWAALTSLIVPWALVAATTWTVAGILLTQLLVFAVVLLLLGLPVVRHRLVPRRVQRAAAHRLAAEQFVIRDLAAVPDGRAVLLFLSQGERYARVLAGSGAEAEVPEGHWRAAIEILVSTAKQGRHADAFVAALEHCAKVLQPSCPAAVRVNALPDRFIVLG